MYVEGFRPYVLFTSLDCTHFCYGLRYRERIRSSKSPGTTAPFKIPKAIAAMVTEKAQAQIMEATGAAKELLGEPTAESMEKVTESVGKATEELGDVTKSLKEKLKFSFGKED